VSFDGNSRSGRCGNPGKTSREEALPVRKVLFLSRSVIPSDSRMFGRFGREKARRAGVSGGN